MRTDVVEDENGMARQPDDRVTTVPAAVPAPLRAARSMSRQCTCAVGLQRDCSLDALSVAQTSNYQEMVISQRSSKENIRENEGA
jgi:hypothetical protein